MNHKMSHLPRGIRGGAYTKHPEKSISTSSVWYELIVCVVCVCGVCVVCASGVCVCGVCVVCVCGECVVCVCGV